MAITNFDQMSYTDKVDVKPVGLYKDTINGQSVIVTVYPKVNQLPKKLQNIKSTTTSTPEYLLAKVTHAWSTTEPFEGLYMSY